MSNWQHWHEKSKSSSCRSKFSSQSRKTLPIIYRNKWLWNCLAAKRRLQKEKKNEDAENQTFQTNEDIKLFPLCSSGAIYGLATMWTIPYLRHAMLKGFLCNLLAFRNYLLIADVVACSEAKYVGGYFEQASKSDAVNTALKQWGSLKTETKHC